MTRRLNGTKITGLTALNVRALNEVFADAPATVITTKTTAMFPAWTAAQALAAVEDIIESLPMRGHPKASLWAVRRKLMREVT